MIESPSQHLIYLCEISNENFKIINKKNSIIGEPFEKNLKFRSEPNKSRRHSHLHKELQKVKSTYNSKLL